jgi:hypothetical protein
MTGRSVGESRVAIAVGCDGGPLTCQAIYAADVRRIMPSNSLLRWQDTPGLAPYSHMNRDRTP